MSGSIYIEQGYELEFDDIAWVNYPRLMETAGCWKH